jgi:hypothetical protein
MLLPPAAAAQDTAVRSPAKWFFLFYYIAGRHTPRALANIVMFDSLRSRT